MLAQTADVFISVAHGGPQQPPLKGRETLLSPTVVCGPRDASVKLKKPAVVSMPHCAALPRGGWAACLLENDRSRENKAWEKVVVLGQGRRRALHMQQSALLHSPARASINYVINILEFFAPIPLSSLKTDLY